MLVQIIMFVVAWGADGGWRFHIRELLTMCYDLQLHVLDLARVTVELSVSYMCRSSVLPKFLNQHATS